MAEANRKMRVVTPPVFIRLPAMMKNGMASSVNPVVEEYIRCATIVRFCISPNPTKNSMAVKAILRATGIPKNINRTKTAKIASVSIQVTTPYQKIGVSGALSMRVKKENPDKTDTIKRACHSCLGFA